MQLSTARTMPVQGYAITEYLLVLHPHEELRNKITQVKKEFYANYQLPSALAGKPHITLVNFLQYGLMEERIVNRLKAVAMGYSPLEVALKDYGSFPSHTIYVNVTSKMPIQSLVREIRHNAQRLMKLNSDNQPHFIMEPHITVARKLLPWQYEKGWLEYSHRQFTGRFIADGMLLLKRPEGGQAWQIVQRFNFQNLPVSTKQGNLFIGL
jgi:2'-5' RNA ligase